jgi:hypothetical protein
LGRLPEKSSLMMTATATTMGKTLMIKAMFAAQTERRKDGINEEKKEKRVENQPDSRRCGGLSSSAEARKT